MMPEELDSLAFWPSNDPADLTIPLSHAIHTADDFFLYESVPQNRNSTHHQPILTCS